MKKANKIAIYWLLFFNVVLCFAFIFFVFPFTHDDWWYWASALYNGVDCDGHHTIYDGIRECIIWHYQFDTSRIGNTLGIIFLLFPKWISAIITSIAFGLSYFLMSKLARINPGELKKLIVLTFILVFGFFWQDHMFTYFYAFNYIIILPIFLYAVYLFINSSRKKIWEAIFLGLLIGCWHESYAASFIAGGGILFLLSKKFRTKWHFAVLISLIIGITWHFIFPGVYERAGGLRKSIFWGIRFLPYASCCLFTVILFFISGFSKKWSKVSNQPLIVFTVSSSLVLIPVLILTQNARAVVPALFLSIPSLILFIEIILPKFFIIHSLKSRLFSLLLIILVFTHLISVCYETIRLKNSVESLISEASKDLYNGKVVFYQTHYPWNYSLTSLDRPDHNLLVPVMSWINTAFPLFINRPQLKSLIPIELKDFTSEHDGLNIWRGHIISSDVSDLQKDNFLVKYKYWSENRPCYKAVFPGADGKEYIYILPQRSKIGRYMGDPIEVRYAE